MNEVDAFLKKQIEDNHTPSVQYIFFDKDKVIYNFTYGWADIESQRNINENSTYNAYSVTKTFTALAVLQLAERKLLGIEESLKTYLPDFIYSSEITIRQLLMHSA